MKKLALTIAIVLGLGLTSFADDLNGGGMFQRGAANEEYTSGNRDQIFGPRLPNHGETGNQPAPLGSGVALLLGLGGAYLVTKKRREE